MQRIMDIILSSIAILIFLPIFVIITIVLRLTGEGHVFFLQERIGKNGKVFKLYKFATMLKNSPDIGTGTLTVKDDPRVLPVGRFLRSSKINELPQLFNILFGDMSLVGPRPLTIETFNAYSSHVKGIVTTVRPGLSGIGSLVFRGEEGILDQATNPVDFYLTVVAPYKGALEEWYIQQQSFDMYLKVILTTIYIVIFPNTSYVWNVFGSIPKPPIILRKGLRYPQAI